LQPLSGPHQSRAEWCEAGSAALLPFHQWRFEECRPRFDQIPGMPVRHAFALRSMTDLSGDADLIQKIQHDPDGLGIVVLCKPPDRFDLNVNHLVAQNCIYRVVEPEINIIFRRPSNTPIMRIPKLTGCPWDGHHQ
jgi:hypothetical protein